MGASTSIMHRQVDLEKPLETPRIILESLLESHAAILFPSLLDARMYQFIPQEPPTSKEALAANYRARSRGTSPDGKETWLNWAMRLRETETYVGTLEVTIYPDGRAHLAYFVFPDFQRQGYAKEGCERVIKFLFEDRDVRCVLAEMDTRNLASVHLVETLGFERVSTKENADFFKGEMSHEYCYGLTRLEFK